MTLGQVVQALCRLWAAVDAGLRRVVRQDGAVDAGFLPAKVKATGTSQSPAA